MFKAKHESWDQICRMINEVEFPNDMIHQYGGFPPNSGAQRVTSTIVSGLMGYLSANCLNKRVFLHRNYGIYSGDPAQPVSPGAGETNPQQYDAIADALSKQTRMELCTQGTDDCFVCIETEYGYWIFWLDRGNRSSVYHLSKERFGANTFDQVVDLFIVNRLKRGSTNLQPAVVSEVKKLPGHDYLPEVRFR